MIGTSLPLDWLNGEGTLELDYEKTLAALKEAGTRSIELRTVRAKHEPEMVLSVAKKLWDRGFLITVHGEVKSEATALSDVFSPLASLLPALQQKTLNITIHPIDGDNAKVLNTLADHIEEHGYPVTVSLENNRLLPDKTEGDSAELVLRAVTEVNRACIGICFDFGHYIYYRKKNFPEEPIVLPPKEFFRRVIHTHIHGVDGLKTHFPLDVHPIPLAEIFGQLSFEYFGLYNLELDFPRFAGRYDPRDALLGSVATIRRELPICATTYDEVRDCFDGWFSSALQALDGNEGTKFGLIHSTSYLFNTNGFLWGMDVAFRNAWSLAETPKACAELLKALRLMIISHGHRDHFERETVRALAHTDMQWLIPDFLYDTAIEYGLRAEQIIVAHEGEAIRIGPLTILPFPGRHFRPGTTLGVPEYGYYVTAENAPSMVFPLDVRDLSLDGVPDLPNADYCFSNVWLGDGKGLEESYDPIVGEFARFMLAFGGKHIFLTHLNENGRKDADMWRDHHGELVKERMLELSPDVKVTIPACGEVITLTEPN
ncbi:MAG: hypothetical protein IKB75_06860 [Clostridia bacterium]|nr:hypothetical protein [Clostridia bacterium]